jgi:hypothetical protein
VSREWWPDGKTQWLRSFGPNNSADPQNDKYFPESPGLNTRRDKKRAAVTLRKLRARNQSAAKSSGEGESCGLPCGRQAWGAAVLRPFEDD